MTDGFDYSRCCRRVPATDDGVPCTNEGALSVSILFWSDLEKKNPPAEVVTPLRVCKECSRALTVDSFITDEGFDQISQAMIARGKGMLVRETGDLVLEPVQ